MPDFVGIFALIVALSTAGIADTPRNPPSVPVAPPITSYPACRLAHGTLRGGRAQLRSLRACRVDIQLFRDLYANEFSRRLRAYSGELQAYRNYAAGLPPAQRRDAHAYYETQAMRMQPGGDLAEAERGIAERVRRDLQFVEDEICRIRHQPRPPCS
jgi:hypothetical protein